MARRVLNRRPGRLGLVYLAALPFVMAVMLYAVIAALPVDPPRASPPSLSALAANAWRLATESDVPGQAPLLWVDTLASLRRVALGLALAAAGGLLCGIAVGLLPHARALLAPGLAALAALPALTLLPLLPRSAWGPDAAAILVIAVGVGPRLARALARRVGRLPGETLIKAQTLGATTGQIALRLVLPGLLPSLLTGVRRSLPVTWSLLLAAEALTATVTTGLGHRLFAATDGGALGTVLPYLAWTGLLAVALDQTLACWRRRGFAWLRAAEGST